METGFNMITLCREVSDKTETAFQGHREELVPIKVTLYNLFNEWASMILFLENISWKK